MHQLPPCQVGTPLFRVLQNYQYVKNSEQNRNLELFRFGTWAFLPAKGINGLLFPTTRAGLSCFCYSARDMTFMLKRLQKAVCALLFGLGCVGASTRAQDSSAKVPGADSKTANNAEFIAAADEVLQDMSQITGLKLLTPLKKSLRSREEIRAYVIKQMNEEKNSAERYADAR